MNVLDIRFDASRDWPEIERFLRVELDTKRDALESTELSDVETAAIRGELRVIRNLLRQPIEAIEAAAAPVTPFSDD